MLSSGLICLLLVADSAIAINRYGYTMNSCGDFRPRRVDTNSVEGSHFGSGQHQSGSNRFGPSADGAASPDGFGQPILMTSFAPYRIWIENNRYRRGGVMKVRLDGRDDFDGYLMEARALGGGASSKPAVAGVGRWVGFPATAMLLNCRDRQSSAVTNVPSPYRMNNLTFQWEAPFRDVGDIFFVVSVLLDDRYWVLTSDRLMANPFPGELVGCGIRRTCVRLCGYQFGCSLDEAEYVLIIEIDGSSREATFTIGGNVNRENNYLALGLSRDENSLMNMDVTACILEPYGAVSLGHYEVRSPFIPPYPHNGIIVPDITDVDKNRIWCRFRRPLLDYGSNSISPFRPFYHFYFKGTKNVSGLFLPESLIYAMNVSPRPINITEFYTDVQMSNVAVRGYPPNLTPMFATFIALYFSFSQNTKQCSQIFIQ